MSELTRTCGCDEIAVRPPALKGFDTTDCLVHGRNDAGVTLVALGATQTLPEPQIGAQTALRGIYGGSVVGR